MKIFTNQRMTEAKRSYYPWKMPVFTWIAKGSSVGQEIFRNQIEGWYKNYTHEKKDLLQRLVSLNDTIHLSVFYELLWHQFLLEEGWKLIRHPLLPSCQKRPEFLVKNDVQNFYLEVATVFDKEDLRRSKQFFDDLLNALGEIKHYYQVSIAIKSWPDKPLKKAAFKKAIEKYLDTVSENHHGKNAITIDNFTVEVEILKDRLPSKTPIIYAVHFPGFSGSPGAPQMRKALKRKVKKYKDIKHMDMPLVIALCSEEGIFTDSRSLDYELFGYPVVTWTIGKNSTSSWSRARNGLVVPSSFDLSNPTNTRLSAVIFCKKMWSGTNNRMEYIMEVYHNPWAKNPLNEQVFAKLPQFVAKDDGAGGKVAEWKNRDPNKVIVFNS